MGLGDTQIGQQLPDRLRGHGTATIGMDGQLPRLDTLSQARLSNEIFGQCGRFPVGNRPTDGIAAEDIQDFVEIIICPFRLSQQFGNVP
jgi:hypothetical protein